MSVVADAVADRELDVALRRLSQRRRVHRAAVGGVFVLAIVLLGCLGLRVAHLAAMYPSPEHRHVLVGEAVDYPGRPDVSVQAVSAGYISAQELQRLCPKFYKEIQKLDYAQRFVRVDVEVVNGGSTTFSSSELSRSMVTVGDSYANAAMLPAMTEAFPDKLPESVGPGETKGMSFLFGIADISFSEEQWGHLEELPLGFQICIWPKTVTIDIDS